jgi:hypothetical protein
MSCKRRTNAGIRAQRSTASERVCAPSQSMKHERRTAPILQFATGLGWPATAKHHCSLRLRRTLRRIDSHDSRSAPFSGVSSAVRTFRPGGAALDAKPGQHLRRRACTRVAGRHCRAFDAATGCDRTQIERHAPGFKSAGISMAACRISHSYFFALLFASIRIGHPLATFTFVLHRLRPAEVCRECAANGRRAAHSSAYSLAISREVSGGGKVE